MVDSEAKLKALRLPPLQGASFLDVGCNEGYYCKVATDCGARKVIGLDGSDYAIKSAKQRFLEIEFIQADWSNPPEGKFDVILLTSIIHYARTEAVLRDIISKLASRLNTSGTLVIETGLSSNDSVSWEEVIRSDNSLVRFPSKAKLFEILYDYNLSMRFVGDSSIHADSRQRAVFHCSPLQKQAFIIQGESGIGKTYLTADLGFKAVLLDLIMPSVVSHFPILDEAYYRGVGMTKEVLQFNRIDPSYFIAIFKAKLESELALLRDERTLIVEGYCPDFIHKCIRQTLGQLGYRVWEIRPQENINAAKWRWPSEGHITDGSLQYPIHQPGSASLPLSLLSTQPDGIIKSDIHLPAQIEPHKLKKIVAVYKLQNNSYIFISSDKIQVKDEIASCLFNPIPPADSDIVNLFIVTNDGFAIICAYRT